MSFATETFLIQPRDLLIEHAIRKEENPFREDVYALYNPDGYGGVFAVGKEIVDLIRACDGTRTVATAIKKAGIEKENVATAISFAQHLIEKDFLLVRGSEHKKNNQAWNKELTCWLHITNDCNLRCTYCYIHKTHSNMPDDILYHSIDKMMDSCRKHGYSKLSLMLVGGEPLTRFDTVKSIVEYCNTNKGELEVKFIIPTNGTLITPEVAQYIVQNQISVGVSIDGTEVFHDKNRIKPNGKGSFQEAMRGIDNLIAEGLKPSIMVTVTNENLEGLPELTKMMIEKKIFFRFSFERDTQSGHPSILSNEKRCIEILYQCFGIMADALNHGKLGWRFQFGDVTFGRPCRRACAAGKNFFAIGQDGSIGSCSLGLECTRANIDEMEDVISDISRIFADIGKTSACDVLECKECVWRHSCAGACPMQTLATYQTLNHVSPYCHLYQECLPEVIRIFAMTIYYQQKEKEVK